MKIYEILSTFLSNTKTLVTQALLYLFTLLYISYYIIVSQQPEWSCLLPIKYPDENLKNLVNQSYLEKLCQMKHSNSTLIDMSKTWIYMHM